jgi:N-acetylglutamate synthase-like GNAT family acetyltransferase
VIWCWPCLQATPFLRGRIENRAAHVAGGVKIFLVVSFRIARIEDVDFVFRMVTMAAFPPGHATLPTPEESYAFPHLARWSKPLERAGDFAVIAEDSDGLIGAAMARLFVPSERSIGLENCSLPELAIAIEPQRRGDGSSVSLLQALQDSATHHSTGLALVVSTRNDVAKHLYSRCGFERLAETNRGQSMVWVPRTSAR